MLRTGTGSKPHENLSSFGCRIALSFAHVRLGIPKSCKVFSADIFSACRTEFAVCAAHMLPDIIRFFLGVFIMKMTQKKAIAMLQGMLAAGLITASQFANAVIDVTAATTGIADAATAIGAVIAALLALSVTIFGVAKVYSFMSRKAGA